MKRWLIAASLKKNTKKEEIATEKHNKREKGNSKKKDRKSKIKRKERQTGRNKIQKHEEAQKRRGQGGNQGHFGGGVQRKTNTHKHNIRHVIQHKHTAQKTETS